MSTDADRPIEEEDKPAKDLGWHTMPGELLLSLLRRCYKGEDPDLVFVQLWANAEREDYRDG